MELLIVLLAVAASSIYLVRRIWTSFTVPSDAGCAGGCAGCSGTPSGQTLKEPADACLSADKNLVGVKTLDQCAIEQRK
jgi:hypothetical protein